MPVTGDYIPDPNELSEARQERMIDALNIVGGLFTCPICGQRSPLADAVPMGPGPDAMPMCRHCGEDRPPHDPLQ